MGMWSRFRNTLRGKRHSDEIQEELRFHLHMDQAAGRERRDAHMRLGNVTRIEEETRAMGIIEWIESAFQDARYGLRQLRRVAGNCSRDRSVARDRRGRQHSDLQPGRCGDPSALAGPGSGFASHHRMGQRRVPGGSAQYQR